MAKKKKRKEKTHPSNENERKLKITHTVIQSGQSQDQQAGTSSFCSRAAEFSNHLCSHCRCRLWCRRSFPPRSSDPALAVSGLLMDSNTARSGNYAAQVPCSGFGRLMFFNMWAHVFLTKDPCDRDRNFNLIVGQLSVIPVTGWSCCRLLITAILILRF